ncbi:HAD family hydrolase [Phycisphaerales bacterium AB-hyl4]|uniref:phosphoglycolate phosphatase n=1 Tax=Natronomicrosphaera hydrolytica TaxID=3242702 RepID=A0ABV4U6G2_9BACT
MSRALILFDIDGTLMLTGGAGSRCLRRAGRAILGEAFQWCPVQSGLLDPQIFAQLAQHNGVDQPDLLHDMFRKCYLRELEQELAHIGDDVVVLPGVRALLDALLTRAHEYGDVTLGLLSGNYRRAAELKLAAAHLDWATFTITALAEDGQSRDDLPLAAMRQYQGLKGTPVRARHVVIIGDTPRDVACAKAHACQIIAVATGFYSMEQLRAAGARHVLPNLAHPDAFHYVMRCAGLMADQPVDDGDQSSTST